MNPYEEKQERRRQRLEARAAKKKAESDRAYNASNELAKVYPLGQPILVGHHSEKRHRRTLERARNLAFKALDLDREAEEIARRAEAVGKGGISSDNPEAVQQLTEKLKGLEEARDVMKAANAFYRKHGTLEGFDGPPGIKNAAENNFKYSQSKVPFPPYCFSNGSANIRRYKARIEELKKPLPDFQPIDAPKYRVELDKEANRLVLTLKERVSKDQFKKIRGGGWLWSHTRTAFVRMATPNGFGAAKYFLKGLFKDETAAS